MLKKRATSKVSKSSWHPNDPSFGSSECQLNYVKKRVEETDMMVKTNRNGSRKPLRTPPQLQK
jgi:hypothetical protein